MNVELVINSTKEGTEIALLHDRTLVELHKEHVNQEYAVGDLYVGKVRKVLPSLNAAFVDVGYERDAFLHYLDLGPQFASMKLYARRVMTGKQQSSSLADFRKLPDIDKGGKIKDQLSSSQQVLVQVAKEPISAKGPRLTTEVTLPGRFIVLVPFSTKISLSQRIQNEEERTRLRRLMQSIKPPNFGVIVRTVAENKGAAELHADLSEQVKRWEQLYDNLKKNKKPPHRVLGEIGKTNALLRDILTPNFSAIHVNDEGIANEVKDFLRSIAPDKEGVVKLSKGKDLFDTFHIHKQIKATFGKQVNLKSGAYLIIEHTEAMHVIDVNSGGRKGGVKNQEENALQTNLECAREIARILRLRDMGGIICIDFIDMGDRANQKKLFEELKKAMSTDKAKHNILPPSRFGVVEITRQRVREVTDITTAEKCPSCGGKGVVEAPILFTDTIENNLRYLREDKKMTNVRLVVHPMVEAYLTKGLWNSTIKKWRKQYKMKIALEANSSLQFLEHHFYDSKDEEITL
ncbi:Rne/Rng family ribonuclease [Sanyastnella coralliicola]|uniref:Rne/Rng family ribonuclease n=1 Tax=Sanyastnella coralliicola TaxID=3069118 RepID=UPI0027BAC60A|nr:Rne/Rng family ribonuclease [Longitalea sp. SCSIO 12813]